MEKQRRAERYAAAVVGALTEEFPDLDDPMTAKIVRDEVVRHVNEPGRAFECVLDDLALANWRLRPNRTSPRVRVACYHLNPSNADLDRERQINHALDGLTY